MVKHLTGKVNSSSLYSYCYCFVVIGVFRMIFLFSFIEICYWYYLLNYYYYVLIKSSSDIFLFYTKQWFVVSVKGFHCYSFLLLSLLTVILAMTIIISHSQSFISITILALLSCTDMFFGVEFATPKHVLPIICTVVMNLSNCSIVFLF